MNRRIPIILCAIAVALFIIVYEFLNLYNTPWRPFLYLELLLLVAILVVCFVFRYDWEIGALFEWITRARTKSPDFGCVRCQSQRVIIHERMEEGFLHRRFWCKDCGYEWSNIEPQGQTDEKST